MNNEIKKKVDGHIGNLLINLTAAFSNKKSFVSTENIPKDPKRILLIKFWGMGNLIMLTPTMKAIRQRFPDSKIYFLTLSKNRGLLENLDYLDGVIYYELGALDVVRIMRFINKYHKRFDIVIDFEQFLNISSIITHFLGKYSLGFSNKTRERHKLYDYYIPCRDDKHFVEQFYDLCRNLGLKETNLRIESFDFISSNARVTNYLLDKGLGEKDLKSKFLVLVHAGSSENAEVKRWPRDYYIKLINLLNKRFGDFVFFMSGTASEKDYVDSIVNEVEKGNCYNTCGILSLKELIFLMKRCDMFIGNDTGPIHLASACGITCVGFYGPTSPVLYGPHGEKHIIFYDAIDCGPCVNNYNSKSSNCKKVTCMKRIKPKVVADRIVNYIKKNLNPR